MLKQILVTSACVAILAVSAQSATAAGSKFRQLVVEPAGTPSSDLLLKNKKIQPLIATAGQGIPTPSGAAIGGKVGGNPGGKFIVAQGSGIPTPGDNGGTGNGKVGGAPVPQFVVAPTGGIPTGAGGASGNGKAVEPLLVNAPSGIPVKVATADPGVPADIAPPVTPSPQASVPATGNSGSGIVNADAAPAANPDAGTPPVIVSAPAAAAGDGAAGSEPPIAAAAAAPASAVQNPTDLYALLTGRGYSVQIMDQKVNGNLVFYVTIPGDAKHADLLLVDATYGKVIDRKHIATSSYDTISYAGGDNCDHFAGY